MDRHAKKNRLHLYLKGIGSAYFLLAVNIVYSFVSIPILVYYLGKETFGLWALTFQIGAVVQLADLGLSGALVRILIDYKDNKESPEYKQALFSVWAALALIAAIILIIFYFSVYHVISLLSLDIENQQDYPRILLTYLIVFALGFSFKPIGLTLAAHQRSDLLNWTSSLGLVLSFIVLLACLHAEFGLWSLVYSQSAVTLLSVSINFYQARRCGFIPNPKLEDFFHWERLREVAAYGWQRLVAIGGATMLTSAPTFLITRFLGLEATAMWAIGTRVQQLLLQITAKLPELAFPSLVEMHVRGETELLKRRFLEVLTITGGSACALAGILMACNSQFVGLWTHQNLSWDLNMDVAIALFLPVIIYQKIFWYPASIAKNLGAARYVSLIEALILSAIIIFTPNETLSLFSVAIAMIVAGVTTSLPLFIWRTSKILEIQFSQILNYILLIIIRIGVPTCFFAYVIARFSFSQGWTDLIFKGIFVATIGLISSLSVKGFRKPIFEIINKFISRTSRTAN
jgi:O-antigen/teichoic acid export membrane protein